MAAMKRIRIQLAAALFACLLLLVAAPAQSRQDPAAVRKAVEDLLRVQAQGLPGEVAISVDPVNPSNQLAACPALEAFLPAGARAWGRTTVGVRCLAEGGWSLFVRARVRVIGRYLIAGRPLARGQTLAARDLAVQSGDLAALPGGIALDPSEAVGRTLSVGLAAGQPLRIDLLREPLLVEPGQTVKVISRGAGFQVSIDARALTGAAAGELAQVRTANGNTLSGVARARGVVEVSF